MVYATEEIPWMELLTHASPDIRENAPTDKQI